MKAILGLIVLATVVGSCSTHEAEPDTAIWGDIIVEGGPAPDKAIHSVPGEVTIFDGEDEVGSMAVSAGAVFRIPVDPGKYRVVAESGDAMCHDRMVTVLARELRGVHFLCEVK